MKPELLVPCHDFATLKAGVKAGADAVYFGVNDFNMRAKNFKIKDLPEVIKYCHETEVKAYLTVNAVVYEDEIKQVKQLLENAKQASVDAVIVHDLAVLKLAKDLGLEVHVSTQANITNSVAVNLYADLGASRVILSRELSLEQIKEVVKNSSIPVEVFIHGAMCVSISGRCFFSQAMLLKNANRGECLQPCRRQWTVTNQDGELIYDGERFLNSKDLCMIDHVKELLELGVASFKIEGRMRDPNYVSTVASVYREAIDGLPDNKWHKRLESVFNRGFCTGFYYNLPDSEVNLEFGNNLSSVKKVKAGVVINYFKEPSVAVLKLDESGLKVGDEVMIIDSNIFLKQIVRSLEVEHQSVKQVSKGGFVGLKVNEPVRKGAIIYKLETNSN